MPFPIEIFESIINLLRNDPNSLKSCSLVCYNLALLTRKHIFKAITIDFGYLFGIQRKVQRYAVKDGPSLPPSIQCALNILDTPTLAHHLRHVRIQNYDERGLRRWNLTPATPAHVALCLILGAIERLDSFALSLDRLAYDHGVANRLCQPAEAELIAMFKRARVSEVNLQFVTHLPIERIALDCPDIRKLGFVNCGNQSDHGQFMHNLPSQLEERCGHLESLVLSLKSTDYYHRLRDATQIPHARLDLTRLRELSILGSGERLMRTADQVWTDAGASLERLTWHMNWVPLPGNLLNYTWTRDSAHELPFRHTLRSLRLSFGFCGSGAEPFGELEWLQSALYKSSQVVGPSALEELVMVLSTASPPVSCTGGRQKQLMELDAHLNAVERYPHFRRLAVFIHFAPFFETTTAPPCTKDEFSCSIMREMPMLSKRGILMVRWLDVKRGEAGLDMALQVLEGEEVGI
ncbi:hypothetical protein H0H81_010223 [Sphagnurus paluster]|uniref:Uncharacterized protein n=1 Tax=Sphagnurus paluster TaxID=117069 RepID=A0A9P7GI30_9AGAR|nr:hypothetical protein H0H81_010223 [Sphagnurus paluster]